MCATYNSYDGHSHLWPLAHAPFPCSITLSGIGDRQQQLWDHRTADHLRSPPISLLGVVRSLAVFAYRPALCGTSLASRCSSHRAFRSANAPRSPCTVPVVFGIWEEENRVSGVNINSDESRWQGRGHCVLHISHSPFLVLGRQLGVVFLQIFGILLQQFFDAGQ